VAILITLRIQVCFFYRVYDLDPGIFTSAEEITYSSDSVCLCVSVRDVQNISKSYERILMKFGGQVESGPGRNQLDFGGDPNADPLRFLNPDRGAGPDF